MNGTMNCETKWLKVVMPVNMPSVVYTRIPINLFAKSESSPRVSSLRINVFQ